MATSKAPQQQQQQRVYLRIKRKREDSSLENVVVESKHIQKKQNVSVRDIAKQLDGTDLNQTQIVFRRFDTVDGFGKCVSQTTNTRGNTTSIAMKGVLETNTKGGFCYIDLEAMETESPTSAATAASVAAAAAAAADVPAICSNRVLNPMQRELDEAIWIAFARNDFSKVFSYYKSTESNVNFQRPVDGSTALMAAAHHNRADVIDHLLKLGASSLVRDHFKHNAMDIALAQGHTEIAQALYACVRAEQDKAFVYDVYCVADSEAKIETNPTVLQVDAEVEEWLAKGDLMRSEQEHLMQYDSDWSDRDSDASNDSNIENYHTNDYPDEEDSGEDSEIEPSRMVWQPHASSASRFERTADDEDDDDDDDEEEKEYAYF